jgi:hypothetical protein
MRINFTVLFWQILQKSRIFRYWYKRFLNELMFDLQLYDIEKEKITTKYQAKLDKVNQPRPNTKHKPSPLLSSMFDYRSNPWRAFGYVVLGLAIVPAICVFIHWWQHPQLTQMQLFLETWPFTICSIVLVIIGGAMISQGHPTNDD